MPVATVADGSQAGRFEFSMQTLYCELFQERQSPERERRLDAVFESLEAYTRCRKGVTLRKTCWPLYPSNTYQNRAGVGSFRFSTLHTLWEVATEAWQDGWPVVRVAEGAKDSDDELPRKL